MRAAVRSGASAIVIGVIAACNGGDGGDDGGVPDDRDPASGGAGAGGAGGMNASGGTESSDPTDSGAPGVDFGRVELAGASDTADDLTRSYYGTAMPAELGGDLVRLRIYLQPDATGPARVEIAAGAAERLFPDVVAWFALDGDSPFAGAYPFDENAMIELAFRARFTQGDPAAFTEYEYGREPHASSPLRSYCWVEVTEIETTRLSGTLECRDLFPTADSLDFPPPGFQPPRASLTLSFSGVPEIIDVASPIGNPSTGGASGGGGRCTGVATPCAILGSSQCLAALGCLRDGECTGYPPSCFTRLDSFSCRRVSGCYWSVATERCSGSANSCQSQLGSTICSSQEDCRWEDTCSGSAWSCSSIVTEITCLGQPGCTWID